MRLALQRISSSCVLLCSRLNVDAADEFLQVLLAT